MTTIGIIRHGSTLWNKEGRAQGSSDIPLDEEGLFEAHKLSDRLGKENWDVIFSSDLLRAKQTTEIISSYIRDVPIYYDHRLREVLGGQIEGTTEQERIEKWGKEWRNLDLGIESSESLLVRTNSLIDEIAYKHKNKKILIVSHGSFIKHLLRNFVSNINLDEQMRNSSITKITLSNEGWRCELYNCTKHLEDDTSTLLTEL